MTEPSDEIMERARAAYWSNCETLDGQIETIARAIMEAEERGAAREREQCAKQLDDKALRILGAIDEGDWEGTMARNYAADVLTTEAAAIRARGQQ